MGSYYNYNGYYSRVPITRNPVAIAYTYKVIVPPASLPLTLSEVKKHLEIDPLYVDDDDYLTLLISAVAEYFECFTNRTLINTTFRTYRDRFADACSCFVLRKAVIDPSTVEINYKKDSVLTPVPPTDYYVTDESSYPGIYLFEGKSWPSDADRVVQAIQIDFVAGFGPDETSIPPKLKIALLNHIAALYTNRGDCDSDTCASALTKASGLIYGQYKILSASPFSICRAP